MALDKKTFVNVAAGVVVTALIAFGVSQCNGKKTEAEKAEAFKTALEKVEAIEKNKSKETSTVIELGKGAVNNGNIVVVNGCTKESIGTVKSDTKINIADTAKNNGNIIVNDGGNVQAVVINNQNNCVKTNKKPEPKPVSKDTVKVIVKKEPDTVSKDTAKVKRYYIISTAVVVKKSRTVYNGR